MSTAQRRRQPRRYHNAVYSPGYRPDHTVIKQNCLNSIKNISLNLAIRLITLFLSFPVLISCSNEIEENSRVEAIKFATWSSQEPDTLASIWLVETFISPGTKVAVLPPGAAIENAISIAVPEGMYSRTENRSAFATLMDTYHLQDAELWRLNEIIDIIEISPWRRAGDREAMFIEANLREAQRRFGSDTGCMVAFFDYVYEALNAGSTASLDQILWQADSIFSRCDESVDAIRETQNVSITPISLIVEWISQGKSVKFIDTREAPEYRSGHIPGAENITLRDMDQEILATIKEFDIVVPYCIKDFRGYEVARFLAAQGVSDVHVMLPHGIAGWKKLGLPIAEGSYNPTSEATALDALRRCANMPNRCIAAVE